MMLQTLLRPLISASSGPSWDLLTIASIRRKWAQDWATALTGRLWLLSIWIKALMIVDFRDSTSILSLHRITSLKDWTELPHAFSNIRHNLWALSQSKSWCSTVSTWPHIEQRGESEIPNLCLLSFGKVFLKHFFQGINGSIISAFIAYNTH